MTEVDTQRREFTLTWTLDAPRAQVFRAWTDPDHLQWYYNAGQPIPDEPIEVDLRPLSRPSPRTALARSARPTASNATSR